MIWLLMAACSGGDGDTSDQLGDDGGDGGGTTELTYYDDIKPLVDTHCVRCHDGEGLGRGNLGDPEVVVEKGPQMVAWTELGLMPPAAADPECRSYQGADHMSLGPDEQALIAAWVDGGSPLGDPANAVELPFESPDLEDADLELVLSSPYEPQYLDDSNPGNEYRCFLLDPELEEDTWITAMDPIVDQDAIVHHVVLLTMPRTGVQAKHLDPTGWDCIDGSGAAVDDMLGAWAPGMMPIEFPEGHGMEMKADDVFVLQMHYYDSGNGAPDQSGYAFKTADSVDNAVFMAPLGIYDFSIPPGAEAHADGDVFDNTYTDLTLHGVFPHMHELGASYSMSMTDPEGNESCLSEGTYDFSNQLTYMWEEPVLLEAGGQLAYECVWNNSESNPAVEDPKLTGYGERTNEEMCFFFTLVSVGAP